MTDRRILAVETSAREGGSAAIVREGGGLVVESSIPADQRSGEGLAPAVKVCLERGGEQVDAVAVNIGPGSYTGLRVGVMFAKAFAWGRSLPLIGVCSLEALAWEVRDRAPRILVAVTARREEIYVQAFDASEEGIRARGPLAVCAPDELGDAVANLESPGMIIGDAVDDPAAAGVRILARGAPSASTVGALGGRLLAEGGGVDPFALQPLYPRREGVSLPVLGERVPASEVHGRGGEGPSA